MSSLVYLTSSLLKDVLYSTYPKGSKENINKLVPYIYNYLNEYDVNTELRICHFIGQIGHETGQLVHLQELSSGSKYEFRKSLGNIYKGDGVKFKGRGIIQLTGRYNYQLFATHFKLPIVMSNPNIIVDDPNLCVLTAFFFWNRNNINRIADTDNIRNVTRVINGGLNGLADRMTLTRSAKQNFNTIKTKLLQYHLNKKLNLKLAVDGTQGQITNNAIALFAKKHNLQTNTLTDSFWSALLS